MPRWLMRGRVRGMGFALHRCPGLGGLGRDDADARVADVEADRIQAQPVQPGADLVGRVPPGVGRIVPVEIDMVVLVEGEVLVPEQLHDVPVEPALEIGLPSRQTQQVHGLLGPDAQPAPAQVSGQGGQRLQGRPGRFGIHAAQALPQVVVSELPDGGFFPVHVEDHVPARPGHAGDGLQGAEGVRGVVEHAVGEDDVEGFGGEGAGA